MKIIILTMFLFLMNVLNAQPYKLRLDSLKVDEKIYLDSVDRMPFFVGLDDSNRVGWDQLTPTVKQQVGAAVIENAPDDVTLELKISGSDTTIGIKSAGVINTALATSALEAIGDIVSDSIAFPIDTLALQQLNMDEGRVANLKQLGTDPIGGGWFTVVDSSDYGSILTTATKGAEWFDHLTIDRVWLRDIYRIRGIGFLSDFGAVGDSITDDYAAVNRAFQSEISIEGVGGNHYRMSETVTVLEKDAYFKSTNGKYVIFSLSVDSSAFWFYQDPRDTEDTLVTDALKGSYYVVGSRGEEFAINDMVMLKSSKTRDPKVVTGGKKGEMKRIVKVSGDTLFFERNLFDNYEILLGSEAVRVINWGQAHAVEISDMDIRYYDVTVGDIHPAIGINHYNRPQVKHCKVDSNDYIGVRFVNCLNLYAYDIEVTNTARGDLGGYGIGIYGGVNSVIDRCYFANMDHGVDGGSGGGITGWNAECRFSTFVNCNASNHEGMNNFTFFKNRMFETTGTPFVVRSPGCKILYNEVYSTSAGYMVGATGNSVYNLQVIGNIYNSGIEVAAIDSIYYEGSYLYTKELQLESLVQLVSGVMDSIENDYVIIKDNIFMHGKGGAAAVLSIGTIDTVENLVMTGNILSVLSNLSSNTHALIATYDTTVIDNYLIRNNQFIGSSGEFVFTRKIGGSAHSIKFTGNGIYEFQRTEDFVTMKDSIWTYEKFMLMDSADYILLEPGIQGWGEVRIDSTQAKPPQGIAKFRFHWGAVATIEDTVGYNGVFSVSETAARFCFIDDVADLRIQNNLGNGKKVYIHIKYHQGW